MRKFLILALFFSTLLGVQAQKTITFASKDTLSITADVYEKENADTFIILFHQARWSRGEYLEIAPKLNTMGYSCIAVDLRSGGSINGIINKTNELAVLQGKATAYVDAFQDIEATVSYVKNTYKPSKIILWGSSYSSALVLKYGGDYPEAVTAILSFAPGEYFSPKDFISRSAKNITVPVFITSAKKEYKNWKGIYEAIPTTTKTSYLPVTKGNHGSRALWEKFDDNSGYWTAVSDFLNNLK
ncbi:MAG: alpha/beta fold hydrolase [Cellulophaga sp.]